MTDNVEIDPLKNTHCYTYVVTMVVQILAPTEELAKEKLDRDGGYVSKRNVELLDSVNIYTEELEKIVAEELKTDQ
jgi:hypothetical protein